MDFSVLFLDTSTGMVYGSLRQPTDFGSGTNGNNGAGMDVVNTIS